MERLVFSFTLLATCTAVRQDLSGKVMIFTHESSTVHVTLTPDKTTDLHAATVCLRFFTDLERSQSLFSLATHPKDNGFVLFTADGGMYQVWTMDSVAKFWGLPHKLSEWMSLCATWDSVTGLTQLWVNGKPSPRKSHQRGGNISAPHSIILGQEQDTFGGDFEMKQSFFGHLTDLHMWDYVLSPVDIQHFAQDTTFLPGNVLKWGHLEYTVHGFVVVEDKQRLTE